MFIDRGQSQHLRKVAKMPIFKFVIIVVLATATSQTLLMLSENGTSYRPPSQEEAVDIPEVFSVDTFEDPSTHSRFSPDSRFIATAQKSGVVKVFDLQTDNALVASKELEATSILFLPGNLVLAHVEPQTGTWRVWNFQTDEILEFECEESGKQGRYPCGPIDNRMKMEKTVFISNGKWLGQLDTRSGEFSKLIEWEKLARLYADEWLSCHGNRRMEVTRWLIADALPTVHLADEDQVVLAFGHGRQFLLEKESEEWSCQLVRKNVLLLDGSDLIVDQGVRELVKASELNEEESEKPPYYGFSNGTAVGRTRARVASDLSFVVDFPPRTKHPGKPVAKTTYSEGPAGILAYTEISTPESPPSALIRITYSDSQKEQLTLCTGDDKLLKGVSGFADLQISPSGDYVCFKINPTTWNCSRTIVWKINPVND